MCVLLACLSIISLALPPDETPDSSGEVAHSAVQLAATVDVGSLGQAYDTSPGVSAHDQDEELEDEDQDDDFCPGPDPPYAPVVRPFDFSPLIARWPGTAPGLDTPDRALRSGPGADWGALLCALACPALDSSVQFLC